LAVIFAFAAHLAIAAKSKVEVNIPSKGKAVVKIPAHAVEVAPGVFSLGTAIHNGKVVEGYAVFKNKENPAKVCGNGICEPGENVNKCPQDCSGGEEPDPDTSSCYEFLARGAKWKTIEPYIVNPTNTRGVDEMFIAANMEANIAKWEAAAGVEILGAGSTTSAILEADMEAPDEQNEVYFGDIAKENAIAVAIVWGTFSAPPPMRELVEWDMVFDQVDFDWSASGEVDKMDFENIATHELGHSVGMKDLYTAECSEMTMYGYASEGETKKRDLADGDIKGIMSLY
jgi:hypothetical protein